MKIFRAVVVTLVTVIIMCIGLFVHAAPPVGKTVLQTYSCKRVNDCYTGIGTGKTGWIAAHDDLIRLYEIRSDGWVKGDYPAGSGRVTRWFKFGDLVMNGNFQNYEANLVNAKTLPVYRTYSSGSSFGTVYNTDKVIVVDEYGSRKCIVYNLDAGGYKMGWVDKNKVAGVTSRVTNTTTNNPMINTSSGVRETSTQVSPASVSTAQVSSSSVNVSFVAKLPLQTYAVRKALCYQQPNGIQEGWIDQGDYVIVEQARNDGWVYGSYPVGSVRKKKWFRASDLLNNANYKAQEMYAPASNTIVYRMSDMRTSLGSVYNSEKVTQVSVNGTNSQIIYKLDNGGYKMGWIPTNKLTAANRLANTTVSNPMINTSSGVRTEVSSKEQQEVAKRYVNAYEDVNLTKIKSGSYIDYNETYWVQKVQGNALYVRYKSNSGQDRYAWVSADVRKELNLDYIWPVDGCYGLNTIYKYSDSSVHSCRFKVNGIACGVDIDAVTNTPVKAVADGRVIEKKFQQYYENGVKKGFGNYLVIEHSGGVKTLYAHMQRYGNGISVNAYVRKGQIIGYVGSTGGSTGPHLHYELSIMNPYEYYGNKLPLKANNCRTDK